MYSQESERATRNEIRVITKRSEEAKTYVDIDSRPGAPRRRVVDVVEWEVRLIDAVRAPGVRMRVCAALNLKSMANGVTTSIRAATSRRHTLCFREVGVYKVNTRRFAV